MLILADVDHSIQNSLSDPGRSTTKLDRISINLDIYRDLRTLIGIVGHLLRVPVSPIHQTIRIQANEAVPLALERTLRLPSRRKYPLRYHIRVEDSFQAELRRPLAAEPG